MVIISLNAIFAYLSLRLTRMAWGRALPFLHTGWNTISAEVRHPDFRNHVEHRRAIGFGGGFLIGGLLWLGVCATSAGFSVYFGVQAVSLFLLR